MADKGAGSDTERGDGDNSEKRKVSEDDDAGPPVKKKISIGLGPKIAAEPKKISISMGSPKLTSAAAPIKISLGSQKSKETAPSNVVQKNTTVAAIFNPDDESDEEEMPPEAKMRMRNIGRNTPTAAGPNSFGKGNLGFCNRQKVYERNLKEQMDAVGDKE